MLGTHSQIIHNNWKLYAENLRDSYHATLLHTFYTTFKVNRLDMDGGIVLSDDGLASHQLRAPRQAGRRREEYANEGAFGAATTPRWKVRGLLEAWDEFDDGITHSIQTIFPNLCIQFTLNSLAIRFFAPRGVDKTELFWIYLGYERDTDGSVAHARDAEQPDRRRGPGVAGGRLHQRIRSARHAVEPAGGIVHGDGRTSGRAPRNSRARRKPPCAASGMAIATS